MLTNAVGQMVAALRDRQAEMHFGDKSRHVPQFPGSYRNNEWHPESLGIDMEGFLAMTLTRHRLLPQASLPWQRTVNACWDATQK